MKSRQLTAEEREFVVAWVEAHADATTRTISRLGLGMCLLAMIGATLIAEVAKPIIQLTIGLAGIALLLSVVSRRLGIVLLSHASVVVAQLIVIAGFAYLLRQGLGGSGVSVTLAAACVMSLGSAFLRLSPFWSHRVLAAEGIAFAVIASTPYYGYPEYLRWVVMCILATLFSWGCEFFRIQRMRSEALNELDARERVRVGERKAMDKELEMARQIQDSYTLPPTQLAASGVRVHTFQKKHHVLGGDWVGVRELPDGRVALLVSDASGKGVQAALVTHALQSLWANASLDPTFEPIAWLERANKTLLVLGKSQLQTMTIGLAIISVREIVYYSAGHVPCFVAVRSESGRYVKALRARGNMVGVVESLDLEPVSLDLSRYLEVHVLLGSDGIFHNAHSTRGPAILSMIDKLERDESAAVLDVESGDDKLLIWVQCRTEASEAEARQAAATSSIAG